MWEHDWGHGVGAWWEGMVWEHDWGHGVGA